MMQDADRHQQLLAPELQIQINVAAAIVAVSVKSG